MHHLQVLRNKIVTEPSEKPEETPEPKEEPLPPLPSWIKDEDKIPLLMAVSMYDTPRDMYGYTLIKKDSRWAMWEKGKQLIVGLRGTDFSAEDYIKDLMDDGTIAGFSFGGSCNLSLVDIDIPQGYESIIFTGHSLGGAAALCLAQKHPNSRAVSFNGGAPPLKPTRVGPGPGRARHYHIEADLISSHMDPKAAEVIRIRKGGKWGTVWPHETARFLEPGGEIIDANQEQESYNRWSVIMKPFVCATPIPGSTIGCWR